MRSVALLVALLLAGCAAQNKPQPPEPPAPHPDLDLGFDEFAAKYFPLDRKKLAEYPPYVEGLKRDLKDMRPGKNYWVGTHLWHVWQLQVWLPWKYLYHLNDLADRVRAKRVQLGEPPQRADA